MEIHDDLLSRHLSGPFEKSDDASKPLLYNDFDNFNKKPTLMDNYGYGEYGRLTDNLSFINLADTSLQDYGFLSLLDTYSQSEPRNQVKHTKSSRPPPKPRSEKEDGKGLRYFSKKVCEKVMQKGKTTYNEVSNELVREYTMSTGRIIEQKNIKRRIYDAFNVLVAMNIIEKDKKEIKWVGSPELDNISNLRKTGAEIKERINKKREILEDLKRQYSLYEKLTERNIQNRKYNPNEIIRLPFVLVHTSCMDEVYCTMNEERSNFTFTFSQPFWIYDDCEILRRIFNTQNNIINNETNFNMMEELKSNEDFSDLSYCSNLC